MDIREANLKNNKMYQSNYVQSPVRLISILDRCSLIPILALVSLFRFQLPIISFAAHVSLVQGTEK